MKTPKEINEENDLSILLDIELELNQLLENVINEIRQLGKQVNFTEETKNIHLELVNERQKIKSLLKLSRFKIKRIRQIKKERQKIEALEIVRILTHTRKL